MINGRHNIQLSGLFDVYLHFQDGECECAVRCVDPNTALQVAHYHMGGGDRNPVKITISDNQDRIYALWELVDQKMVKQEVSRGDKS